MDCKKRVKVILADDSPEFMEGLEMLFAMDEKFEVLAVYRDGKELAESPFVYKADLLVTDIEMPERNGLEAAKLINFRNSRLPMIALTLYKDKLFLNDIIGAGFRGFVYKPETAEKLFMVIEKVMTDQFVFPEDIKII